VGHDSSIEMKAVPKKSLALTIILSVIIYGLGQIYLGFVKRGIIILIAGFVATIVLSLFLPFYLSLPFLVAFWIWQIFDINYITKLAQEL
jgi:TM2 domain-containing membrane protein YozV